MKRSFWCCYCFGFSSTTEFTPCMVGNVWIFWIKRGGKVRCCHPHHRIGGPNLDSMCVYTCVFVSMCVYGSTHVCLCLCVSECVCVCASVTVCIYLCVSVHVSLFVSISVYLCLCVWVYLRCLCLCMGWYTSLPS